MIPISDEQAKAVAATAETGKAGIQLADRVGAFLARMGGDAFAQLGGMATDQIKLWRYKQLLSIQDKVDTIHRERRIEGKTIPIPLKLALPLIESASLEDNQTLQGLWAKLIANAMDPQFSETIHPAYIEILKQLSGDEALIVQMMRDLKNYPKLFFHREITNSKVPRPPVYEEFCASLPLRYPERTRAYLDNLLRLKIVEAENSFGKSVSGWVIATAFGQAFIAACIY